MRLIRILFLFLYAVYAVTPVHLYAVAGGSSGVSGRIHDGDHASTDIVWVNVLLASLFDDDEPSAAGARISTGEQPRGEMVLVMKRRALVRDQLDIKPFFDTKSMPPGGLERPATLFPEYESAKDPLLAETDGCLSLSSDLSPPSLFS